MISAVVMIEGSSFPRSLALRRNGENYPEIHDSPEYLAYNQRRNVNFEINFIFHDGGEAIRGRAEWSRPPVLRPSMGEKYTDQTSTKHPK